MYISRFFIKSAPPSFNSLDFFHLHLLAFTFSTTIIKPLMLLHYTITLSPFCEWDLERTYNGPETDLERRQSIG